MVRKDIAEFIKTIPQDVHIIAASKYVNSEDILTLYQAGIKDYGENRVESLIKKQEELKYYHDIKWHFIGHLQRNKAKQIINRIDFLHSLDSLKLAAIIDKNRLTPLDTYIEVSINLEENKNGVPYYELLDFVKAILPYKNIHLVGLMMMAEKGSLDTYHQFKKLAQLKDEISQSLNIDLPYLSMGMSEDYTEAIQAGATHIRLGRILFDLI